MHTDAQPLAEPRSFSPVENADVRTERVDENHPTLRGLAKGHNDLHDCLDEARGDIAEIKDELGVGKRKKAAGLSSNWQAFRRQFTASTSAIVSAFLAYKLVVLLWPAIALAWSALTHAALKGVF